MLNATQIEVAYKEFMGDLSKWIPDGVISIDLQFLHDRGLLSNIGSEDVDDLTQYFHVVESVEKVTLFNDQFVVWIVPKVVDEMPITYVLIALHQEDKARLEVVFTTYGVYNTPRYVLAVLQHFLADMLETEATLTLFEKNG